MVAPFRYYPFEVIKKGELVAPLPVHNDAVPSVRKQKGETGEPFAR